MSDSDLELKRTRYLDENRLSPCCECGLDVPDEEITTDLGDDVCKACHSGAARKCIECGEVMGYWNGTETKAGFICDNHRKPKDEDEARMEQGDLTDAHDRAMDHIFDSEQDEIDFIEATREELNERR